MPPSVTGTNGHYQPGSYPQHSCVQANYEHHHLLIPHPHHHHHRLQQQPPTRLINTPYGPVPAHTSSMIVPNHHFSIPGQTGHQHNYPYSLRKLDAGIGGYSSTSGGSNSDPVYESIDSDSARHTSVSEEGYCEYCDCGGHPGGDVNTPRSALPGLDRGLGSLVPVSSTGESFQPIHRERPAFFNSGGNNNFFASEQFQKQLNDKEVGENGECNYQAASEIDLPTSHNREDPPTPCPPMAGYYGDSGPQTLPLRPLRTKLFSARDEASDRDRGQSRAAPRDDQEELVPLNMTDGPVFPSDDAGMALLGGEPSAGSGQSMRRRPNPSKREDADVNDSSVEGSARRPIPSLHPHYFLANSSGPNS